MIVMGNMNTVAAIVLNITSYSALSDGTVSVLSGSLLCVVLPLAEMQRSTTSMAMLFSIGAPMKALRELRRVPMAREPKREVRVGGL